MADLTQEFLNRLVRAPVARQIVIQALGTTESVSLALSRHARDMKPPHIVGRYLTGTDIEYGLRPVKQGETPGQVKEGVRKPVG